MLLLTAHLATLIVKHGVRASFDEFGFTMIVTLAWSATAFIVALRRRATLTTAHLTLRSFFGTLWGSDIGFWSVWAVVGSGGDFVLAGEPIEDGFAANLVVGEVDRFGRPGLGFALVTVVPGFGAAVRY